MTWFSYAGKILSVQQVFVKNIYLLLTHEILLHNELKFFIPPEDSENMNSFVDMEEKLTVGNHNSA